MKIGRNELCDCGSGIKYKNCHYKIDHATPNARPIESQIFYDKNWKKNAIYYSSQGCYKWLARKLNNYKPKVILDIGCGDGHGILALKQEFPNVSIISIDENISCIQSAKKLFEKENYTVTVISRLKFEAVDNYHHEILLETNKLRYTTEILLIEADILLEDQELLSFLAGIPMIDIVTIWLIGSHSLRSECINIADLNLDTVGKYRLKVQNRIYELADLLLKKGGILQVADRTEEPNTELLKEDLLDSHRQQASVTNLIVKELDYILYTEPSSNLKIKMEVTPGLSGRIPTDYNTAMISVLSTKT